MKTTNEQTKTLPEVAIDCRENEQREFAEDALEVAENETPGSHGVIFDTHSLREARANHAYYRDKCSEFMGANQALADKLRAVESQRDELLAVLQKTLGAYCDARLVAFGKDHDEINPIIADARAAIAKAKGGK